MNTSLTLSFKPISVKPIVDIQAAYVNSKGRLYKLVYDKLSALKPVELMKRLLENPNDPKNVEICNQLLEESNQQTPSLWRKAVSNFTSYLYQPVLTQDSIVTLTSESFIDNLALLPGYRKILATFPEIEEAFKNKTQQHVDLILKAFKTLTLNEMDNIIRENNCFFDPCASQAYEPLTNPVYLQLKSSKMVVNYKTAFQIIDICKEQLYPLVTSQSPAKIRPAYDVKLDMLNVQDEIVGAMIGFFKRDDNCLDDGKMMKGLSLQTTLQLEYNATIKEIQPDAIPDTAIAEAALEVNKWEVRLEGRETLKRCLNNLKDPSSVENLFKQAYLEKLEENKESITNEGLEVKKMDLLKTEASLREYLFQKYAKFADGSIG